MKREVLGILTTALITLGLVSGGCMDNNKTIIDNSTDDTIYTIEMVDSNGVIIFCVENNLTDCQYANGEPVDNNETNAS